jgi:hypothetical protein
MRLLLLPAVLALAVGHLIAGPVRAQTDPALTAQRAAAMLERAALGMAEADGARDRVDALSETILAYEEGLAALREGMRRAAIREQPRPPCCSSILRARWAPRARA